MIVFGHVTALSPGDWFSQPAYVNYHFSNFSNELLSVTVTFLVQYYVDEIFGFSLNGVECVLYRFFNVSRHEKRRFMNLSF